MDIKLFREEFINDVESTAIEEVLHPEKIFIKRINEVLLDHLHMIVNELDYDNYLPNTPGNRAVKGMKVDGASLDYSTNTINLIICDYNSGEIQTLNNDLITSSIQKMTGFCENAIKGFFGKDVEESQPIVQLAREFARNAASFNKIQLFIASTNVFGNRVKSIPKVFLECLNYKFVVECEVLDFEKIYNTYSSDFEREEIIIKPSDYDAYLPCVKANIGNVKYESYLVVIPGKFLADIYDQYGARLLEDNVRSFLNVTGAVNKGIRSTILNCPDKFFTFNNGISTTAKDIKVEEIKGHGLCITEMTGLQIINGGQTTASLASARIKEKRNKSNIDIDDMISKVFVQMKLTKVSDHKFGEEDFTDKDWADIEDRVNNEYGLDKNEKSSFRKQCISERIIHENELNEEFIRNIAKFANSQNKVTNADLNSNHSFYKRIENFSHGEQKIYAPAVDGNPYQTIWFFERVRGQYNQMKMKMTKAEIDKFERVNPKNQKFTKTELAKYENTFDMLPHFVSWGADVNATKFQATLEKKWQKYETSYNQTYYKELIAKAIMFKHVEKLISHQDWYIENKAYRAQLVTYTLAKFVHCVEKINKCIDFGYIWDKQLCPEAYDNDLAKIAKTIFTLANDENRPVNNVLEYFKRELFWDLVKDYDISLSAGVLPYLVDPDEVKAKKVDSKKEQVLTNSIMLEMAIFQKGVKYWTSLKERGIEQNVINEHEVGLLRLAESYCLNITVKLLTQKQAYAIEKVRIKLEENGIK